MEQHTWSVRVGSTGRGEATVFVRKNQFTVGDPLQFDQEYDQTTALEHVLGAIGADMVNGLAQLAKQRRVEIDQVEAHVEATLDNPLTYLGVVGEEGHPGLKRVQVRVYINSLSPPEKIEAVWKEMLERSPLVSTFRAAIDLELSWKVAI